MSEGSHSYNTHRHPSQTAYHIPQYAHDGLPSGCVPTGQRPVHGRDEGHRPNPQVCKKGGGLCLLQRGQGVQQRLAAHGHRGVDAGEGGEGGGADTGYLDKIWVGGGSTTTGRGMGAQKTVVVVTKGVQSCLLRTSVSNSATGREGARQWWRSGVAQCKQLQQGKAQAHARILLESRTVCASEDMEHMVSRVVRFARTMSSTTDTHSSGASTGRATSARHNCIQQHH